MLRLRGHFPSTEASSAKNQSPNRVAGGKPAIRACEKQRGAATGGPKVLSEQWEHPTLDCLILLA